MRQMYLRNSRLSDKIETNNAMTAEMYDIFTDVKAGFKVIGWVGKSAKPIFYVGAFITALIIWVKTGQWEFKL